MLGHDWASPEATYHCYDLMARKVIPHFKGQLQASRSSHDWARGKRDQLIGRAGEAVVKAITEHVDEQKGVGSCCPPRYYKTAAWSTGTTSPSRCPNPARCWSG